MDVTIARVPRFHTAPCQDTPISGPGRAAVTSTRSRRSLEFRWGMLRELKFSSVIAHGCVVTVVEPAGGPNWFRSESGISTDGAAVLSRMSRPPDNPLGGLTWVFVRPSAFSWHTDGAAPEAIFSVLEKSVILACDVPR